MQKTGFRTIHWWSLVGSTQYLRGHVNLIDFTSPNKYCAAVDIGTHKLSACRRSRRRKITEKWIDGWHKWHRNPHSARSTSLFCIWFRCNYFAHKKNIEYGHDGASIGLTWSFWYILTLSQMDIMRLYGCCNKFAHGHFPENIPKPITSEMKNSKWMSFFLFRFFSIVSHVSIKHHQRRTKRPPDGCVNWKLKKKCHLTRHLL